MPAPSLEDLSHEQLLVLAKQQQGMADLANQLLSRPDTREMVQRAVKKLQPNLVIPELDTKDSTTAAIEGLREDNRKLEQRLIERDVRERVNENRATIKAKYGLSDADVLEVEKMMLDPENAGMSHDAAARVYKASRTPSTPTPSAYKGPTSYQMPEKDIWAPGIGNKARLDRIALEQAHLAFAEVMGDRSKLGTAA